MDGGVDVVNAAQYPRPRRQARTVFIDETSGRHAVGRPRDLADWLTPNDVVVINDAATIPASLSGRTTSGAPLEIRLAGRSESHWWAALLGAGDWRTATEQRPAPPPVEVGDRLFFGHDDLAATVVRVSPPAGRRLEVAFDLPEPQFWRALYRIGGVIQYAYQARALPLQAVQTPVARHPVAVEMPSAAWALTWSAVQRIQRGGATVAWLTHAAGLSSIGDEALDASLPWPEWFTIPEDTVRAIERTRQRGGRIIAVGTSVVRALETVARQGPLAAGRGLTHLRLGPDSQRHAVDGLLTNVHSPGEPHYALLGAFMKPGSLDLMQRLVKKERLLQHEHGDTVFVASS